MSPRKKSIKCKFCEHPLNRPITKLDVDYTSVDYCTKCKRFLCVTTHPDGSVEMFECPKDYDPETANSISK